MRAQISSDGLPSTTVGIAGKTGEKTAEPLAGPGTVWLDTQVEIDINLQMLSLMARAPDCVAIICLMANRAAEAEARRQKILARGRERISLISGVASSGVKARELSEPPPNLGGELRYP